LLNQAGRFLVGRPRDVDDHACACVRERQRRGATDAARRTRYERHLACKGAGLIHRICVNVE
jgi:hypothetical protein